MNNTIQSKVSSLILNQKKSWELAKHNYAQLKKVVSREIVLANNIKFTIQYNPERMISSAAKVDAESIRQRECFLCPAHLPPEQEGLTFQDDYLILVNPFPIFNQHLTIPSKKHTNQLIDHRFEKMLLLAQNLPKYVLFYNGPKCGASAPDHFHFQAGSKGFLPIEEEFETVAKTLLKTQSGCNYYAVNDYLRKTIVFTGKNMEQLCKWFDETIVILKNLIPSEPEPMINILTMWVDEEWRVFIFPRKKHRPNQYFMEGENQIVFSPASVDFGGLLITPREEDFYKLDEPTIINIFEQVTIEDAVWEKIKKRVEN